MTIHISGKTITWKCSKCRNSISTKILKGQNNVSNALEEIRKQGSNKGWNTNSGICSNH